MPRISGKPINVLAIASRKIYTKSCILDIIIKHQYVTRGVIFYRLKQDYNIKVKNRTISVYINDLLKCGTIIKKPNLTDTRKYLYYLTPQFTKSTKIYCKGYIIEESEVRIK